MGTRPLVSAVVANWNGAADLEICLPSLAAQSYQPLEVIVADNASADHSAAVVRKCRAHWLGLERNYGLAGALNRGARSARGEYVLFLNNDMRFAPDFVERMLEPMLGDPSVFAVDAVQYDWGGTKKVHLASTLCRERAGELTEQIAPGLYVRQQECPAARLSLMASAANMLARKSMFVNLEGFDETLPIGAEDVELCWRAWLRGWKTVFEPGAVCWHRVGQSSSTAEGARVRFRGTLTGQFVLATKLLPARYVAATWLRLIGGLAKDLAGLRIRRTQDRLDVLGKSIRRLPALVRKRREIHRAANRTASEQLEQLLRAPDS